MKDARIHRAIVLLLILLWIYTGSSKLLQYETSRTAMLAQVFPQALSGILAWLLPVTELSVAALLVFPRTVYMGLYASLYLLIFFTLYIALIMTGVFGRVPCSCGGVLEEMTWTQHLIFNLFFLALTLITIIYQSKVEPVTGNPKLVTQERRLMRKAD